MKSKLLNSLQNTAFFAKDLLPTEEPLYVKQYLQSKTQILWFDPSHFISYSFASKRSQFFALHIWNYVIPLILGELWAIYICIKKRNILKVLIANSHLWFVSANLCGKCLLPWLRINVKTHSCPFHNDPEGCLSPCSDTTKADLSKSAHHSGLSLQVLCLFEAFVFIWI